MSSTDLCRSCGSVDVFTIKFALEGALAEVIVCSACEGRSWIRDGQDLSVEEALIANIPRRPPGGGRIAS